jgi:uronate dehydrogenase
VKPLDNSKAGHLGYIPQDSAEPYRAAVEAKTDIADPKALSTQCLGGWFVELGHPDDEAGE